MSKAFSWKAAAQQVLELAKDGSGVELNAGQRDSLMVLSQRLPEHGMLIADEVGLGKTRIACVLARAVASAGGRVAIVVPPVLGYQWRDELRSKLSMQDVPPMVRSLEGYLDAWSPEVPTPGRIPWAEHPVLLISHMFCNWSIRSTSRQNWKWALLPAVLGKTLKTLRESGRLPRGFNQAERMDDPRVFCAADWIVEHGRHDTLEALATDPELSNWGSNSDLFQPQSYLRNSRHREGLEQVVGLGLGPWDLIIIDEAHKSRGEDGNLQRLLTRVLLPRGVQTRRLSLTATPIELGIEQWDSTLTRLGISDAAPREASHRYLEALKRVRLCPSDASVREAFRQAAREFEAALGKYLIRRDKREDEWIARFAARSGESFYSYRQERPITVRSADLSLAWRQALCAAESLSLVTRSVDDPIAKRLRLTLGNGHGLSAWLGAEQEDPSEDAPDTQPSDSPQSQRAPEALKRGQRALWWKSVMAPALTAEVSVEHGGDPAQETALYEHPAILAAVQATEDVCHLQQEKVLVFGRFTRPMQALVRLLNARAMVRSLQRDEPWPQEVVASKDEAAVSAASRQLGTGWDLPEVRNRLKVQYGKLERQREKFREELVQRLDQGFEGKPNDSLALIYQDFRRSVTDVAGELPRSRGLPLMAHAMQELLGHDWTVSDPDRLKEAFVGVIQALIEPGSNEEAEDADINGDGARGSDVSWADLELRLAESVGAVDEEDDTTPDAESLRIRPQGAFARLMIGDTKPYTRRLLQQGFNRLQSNPRVLVVQSVVGREGLNLHLACKTVILLHPEWNPAVVEQQIGRVDRLGSLWQQQFAKLYRSGDTVAAAPRIVIRPVIFEGTYDEWNWQVLRTRWDELRAQLHGVVIASQGVDESMRLLAEEINAMAPVFSPAASSCNG